MTIDLVKAVGTTDHRQEFCSLLYRNDNPQDVLAAVDVLHNYFDLRYRAVMEDTSFHRTVEDIYEEKEDHRTHSTEVVEKDIQDAAHDELY